MSLSWSAYSRNCCSTSLGQSPRPTAGNFDDMERFWSGYRDLSLSVGGSTVKIKAETIFSKVDSSVLIISAPSTGRSLCLPAERCVRQTGRHGWRFIVSICELLGHFIDNTPDEGVERRLSMALELAKHNNVYEDIASKFFEVCPIHSVCAFRQTDNTCLCPPIVHNAT